MRHSFLSHIGVLATLCCTTAVTAQVTPAVNAPDRNLLAQRPPLTTITLIVPVDLRDLHPDVQRVAVECVLQSRDAEGDLISQDGQGWSDTLAVPFGGTLAQDMVVHVQADLVGSRQQAPLVTSVCRLYLGTTAGRLVQPSLNEVRSGFLYRARSDQPFAGEVTDTIP